MGLFCWSHILPHAEPQVEATELTAMPAGREEDVSLHDEARDVAGRTSPHKKNQLATQLNTYRSYRADFFFLFSREC